MRGTAESQREPSIKELCNVLGMKPETERLFREDILTYLRLKFSDLPNTTNQALLPAPTDYLKSGGSHWFTRDAGLKYQWENAGHRSGITLFIKNVMKKQRRYDIDALHARLRKVHRAYKCPGCIIHPAAEKATETLADLDDPGYPIDLRYSSHVSDVGSIHHVESREGTPETVESGEKSNPDIINSNKRPRRGHDYHALSGAKRRKAPKSRVTDTISVAPTREFLLHRGPGMSKAEPSRLSKDSSPMQSAATTSSTLVSPEVQNQTKPQTVSSPENAVTSLRYRGKVWHFDSVAHKAKVLELILLQEEKEVESYPILAFSKGVRKAAPGSEDDDEGIGNADVVRDYFRFYTHFMNERFPGNEILLLENGVQPSA
ncbi:hypothetical protein PV11_05935 [Exophiala sideris]|uniref:Uncharacterized protein n=1 Tax=Exophiala sideris TaxID=1016849 RepID=A0A0D1W5Q8_9EURO|nr:hypothetical protein PV11_05935 [Exophiala sideris]